MRQILPPPRKNPVAASDIEHKRFLLAGYFEDSAWKPVKDLTVPIDLFIIQNWKQFEYLTVSIKNNKNLEITTILELTYI